MDKQVGGYTDDAMQQFGNMLQMDVKRIDAAVSVLGIATASEKLKAAAEGYLISQFPQLTNPFVTPDRIQN